MRRFTWSMGAAREVLEMQLRRGEADAQRFLQESQGRMGDARSV